LVRLVRWGRGAAQAQRATHGNRDLPPIHRVPQGTGPPGPALQLLLLDENSLVHFPEELL